LDTRIPILNVQVKRQATYDDPQKRNLCHHPLTIRTAINTEEYIPSIDPCSGELAFALRNWKHWNSLPNTVSRLREQINNLVVRETINSLIRRVSDLEDPDRHQSAGSAP
jgi:hypothetical protein